MSFRCAPVAPVAPVALVVRADDAGSFAGANRGIDEAISAGLVRNASIMVPASHFADAARTLRAHPRVCVGLHVTLTSEWTSHRWRSVLPAHAVPSLVAPDGALHRNALALFEHGVVLTEAMAEVGAQLERARAAGLAVRYLDEHMGVGWVHEPGVEQLRLRDLLRDFAVREGLIWHERAARPLPAEVLALCDDAPAFAGAIAALPPDIYAWVLHPAREDEEVRTAVTETGERALERTADLARAVSPALCAALTAAGVRLIRYDEVPSAEGG